MRLTRPQMAFALVFVVLLSRIVLRRGSLFSGNRASTRTYTLARARAGFATRLMQHISAMKPVPSPPHGLFTIIRYHSAVGTLPAYVTPDPGDGRKHPAILWITGGDCNTIDEGSWKHGPPENDQSARAFHEHGIVTMFPSLRGGNDNPGYQEGFYGEVNDVLAARSALAALKYVDPSRVYLGGHSTGGTLALLTAEYAPAFRAVFAFGPVDNVARYGGARLPFDYTKTAELALRAPERWLRDIQQPTYVFEGTQSPGNISSLMHMAGRTFNSHVHFYPVKRATHFSVLAPGTQLIASKIVEDTGPAPTLSFSPPELDSLVPQ